MTAKAWTDDEIAEEITRCIKEACSFDRHVYERLTELSAESNVSSDSGEEIENTPKKRNGYWGVIEEDEI